MRTFLSVLIVLVLLVCTFGCKSLDPNLIDASAANISARHDAYVQADPALTATEKAAYLRETASFLEVIQLAKK